MRQLSGQTVQEWEQEQTHQSPMCSQHLRDRADLGANARQILLYVIAVSVKPCKTCKGHGQAAMTDEGKEMSHPKQRQV